MAWGPLSLKPGATLHKTFSSLGLLVPESVPSAGSCVARCVRAGMGPGRWLGVLRALLRVLCAMLCDSQAAFSCPLVQGYGRGLASHRVAIAPSDALRQLCLQGSLRPAGAPRRTGQLYIWAASKFLSLAIKRPGSPQGSRARWIPASGPWAHPWPPSRSLCTPSTGSQCVRARLDSPLKEARKSLCASFAPSAQARAQRLRRQALPLHRSGSAGFCHRAKSPQTSAGSLRGSLPWPWRSLAQRHYADFRVDVA